MCKSHTEVRCWADVSFFFFLLGEIEAFMTMRGEDNILLRDAEWVIWPKIRIKKLKSWTSSCKVETKKCVKWSVLWRHSQQVQQPLFCGPSFEELLSCLYSSCFACVVLPQLLLARVSCYFTCIICLFLLACLVICSKGHRRRQMGIPLCCVWARITCYNNSHWHRRQFTSWVCIWLFGLCILL